MAKNRASSKKSIVSAGICVRCGKAMSPVRLSKSSMCHCPKIVMLSPVDMAVKQAVRNFLTPIST